MTYDPKSDHPAHPDLPDDAYEEFDSPATIDSLTVIFRDLGHEVVLLGDGRDFLEKILADTPDFVFNIAEGLGVSRSRESRVPAVLEMLGIPYSGSDPLTLALTLDKPLAKALVANAGLPVPWGVTLEAHETARSKLGSKPPFPIIVKPAWEGSSKGIRNKCLVRSFLELDAVIESLRRDHGQPGLLLEQFVGGDELTVGLLGNQPPTVLGRDAHVVPVMPTPEFVYSLEVKRDFRAQVLPHESPPAPGRSK